MSKKTNAAIVGKSLLVERIADNMKNQRVLLTKHEVELLMDVLLEEVTQWLIKGEKVMFMRFASFEKIKIKPRVAMNLNSWKNDCSIQTCSQS